MANRASLYVCSGPPDIPAECEVYWQIPGSAQTDSNPLSAPCALSAWAQREWDDLSAIDCIFPAEWISNFAVNLPGARKRVLQAALPYAVEEFLIQPLEHYHIAPVGTESDGSIAVAVIDVTLMEAWCSWVDQHFPRVKTRFLVDGWLLPREASEVALLNFEDRVLLRYGDRLCGAAQPVMLDSVLAAVVSAHPNAGQYRRLTAQDLEAEGNNHSDMAAALMTRIEGFQGPDLRQGRYKSQSVLDWRFPAAIVTASLVLSTALLAGSNYYRASVYEDQRTQIETMMEQVYTQTFAQQGKLINLPAQARQHLEKLKAQWRAPKEQPEFFPLFNAVTQLLSTWANKDTSTLRQLSYVERESAINLDLVTADMGHLNSLQQYFSTQGLQASVLSVSEEKGQFLGRMRVKYEPK